MRYFKVKTGFKDEDFISIDETELEASMYAFMTDSKVVLNNGMVRGSNIISITEDWHKANGWNYGYKLLAEDFEIIRRDCSSYVGLIAEVKENVKHLISTNQVGLIGKTNYSKVRALPERSETVEGLHIMHNMSKYSGDNVKKSQQK